jgi:hypothetical protein
MAFKAAFDLPAHEPARFVFCSRHGEFQRTLNILKALAAGEDLSPAEFSLSVHNAPAGLLSIARHNAAGHTTIAAGEDSFRSGLIDAAACLMERPLEPILLVYADEPLPDPYTELCGPGELGLALALLLTAPRHNDDDVILGFNGTAKPIEGESASEQALAFLRFLQRSESCTGADHGWRHA